MVCEWQQAASDVLVAVGRRFVSQVMEEMLRRLQPGVLPHCFVLRTLANLSASNGGWRLGPRVPERPEPPPHPGSLSLGPGGGSGTVTCSVLQCLARCPS